MQRSKLKRYRINEGPHSNPMNDVYLVVLASSTSTIFTAGAFYATTTFRIKKLEEQQAQHNKNISLFSERLAVLETSIKFLVDKFSQNPKL